MRLFNLAVILSLLFISISANESESAVVILTDSNFDELTAKGKWLIEFYAPWCGHCKKLEPIFDEASLLLKKENSGLFLGKVDCTVESELANRFNIRGYPTLKYIRSGIDTPYEGGRTLQAITEFAKRVTRPAVENINENNYQKFLLDNDVAFLLVGGSEIASDVFQTVAAKLQDSVTFGKAPSSFKTKFNTEQDSFMVLLNDDEPEIYQGGFTEEELVSYVMKNRFPLFGQLAAHNFYSVVNNGKLTVIAVVDPNDENTKPYLDIMKTVAKSNKNRFSFGYLDGVEFHQFTARYGIHKLPNFFVYDGADSSYRESDTITGPHTVQSINSFLDDVVAGKIESKGAGGLDQVLRMAKNNIVWVGAALVALIASVIFCCCLPSGEEEKEVKKE